mgnify:CR=1 FL=1
MIKSFKHKGLSELFASGRTRRVRQDLQSRCLRRLDALDQAEKLNDLNVPGFNFHGLRCDRHPPSRASALEIAGIAIADNIFLTILIKRANQWNRRTPDNLKMQVG